MAGSTPASAIAELPEAGFDQPPVPAKPRGVLRRVASRPAGAVGLLLTAFVGLVSTFAPRLAPGDPFRLGNPALTSPSAAHRFGTDNLGRDLFSTVVHGVRTSMTVVLWVTLISALLGLAVGAVSGYKGGLVDRALMRLTELFQTIPRFFLALLALSVFDRSLRNLIIVLGLTSWTLLARVVRAETLSIRTREYVESARSSGASDLRILLWHVLPNILPTAVVVISLEASRVILLEAGLAFLGLSDQNRMSLGFLINNAQEFLEQAWWMSVFPGAAIVVAVLGINLLADSLNDVLNPLLRREVTAT
ncbi:MAG: Dipeptide transport system permease protein DppC [uncultured Acidimicrobiales bacterium]|uniref:Dipeptide transport system permease protein DppC n=1 Tax=uncultured Acidimicrobiales bacterium TaxID=310071 RepID=A0A6J4HNN6_9ACTN|nr:MAG: Dipeptide transport system permease protein DppC [uncultured Acidimicrobiales bacterium]